MKLTSENAAKICMELGAEGFRGLDQSGWNEVASHHFFSHRTDPKPRPEGYRESPYQKSKIQFESMKEILDGYSFPLLEPVEALEPSQTGKVPPEPSKGLHESSGGVETASSLNVGSAEWIRSHQKRYLESWGYHWNL